MHTFPVDKRVQIVEEKGGKAKDHRQVRKLRNGSENPKRNQYDVVCGVSNRVERGTENEQHGRKKACGNGQSANQ